MPSDVCSINYDTIRYINLEVIFFLVGVFARMLAYSFILSAYLWLSVLISSLMYGTLRS